MKLLFCDIKTTGIDHEKNCIIELNCAVGSHGLNGKFSVEGSLKMKIRPDEGSVMDMESMEFNGLEETDIFSYEPSGTAFRKFLNLLENTLRNRQDSREKITIVSFNHYFTTMFLRRWFDRNKNCDFSSYFHCNTIDVSSLSTIYLMNVRHLLPLFTLGTVASALDIPVTEGTIHNGVENLKAVMKIYLKIMNDPKRVMECTENDMDAISERVSRPFLKFRKSKYSNENRYITITKGMLNHE